MTNKIKTVEEILDQELTDFRDTFEHSFTGFLFADACIWFDTTFRNSLIKDRQNHCEALCEVLEAMKREIDYIPTPYGHDVNERDFGFNQGLDQAIQAIKELYNQPNK